MTTKKRSRTRLFVPALVAMLTIGARVVEAQSGTVTQFGQPKTPFSVDDFAKLRWLEGTWVGTAPDEQALVERYHFLNDSTIEITYYADPTSRRETASGRVYLTVGRIYYTLGPGRWGATHVDSAGVYFIPQVNARTTFTWIRQSPTDWTATARANASGHEHAIIYTMRRAK